MTHTACSGTIEIRTDPKNTAYVVTSGARARDTGSDVVVAERSGALLIGDEAERERARQDAFRAFEVGIEDREQAVVAKERVEELWEKSQGWERHDDANAKLRRAFRVGRDERKRQAERDGGLMERMSFGFELAGEVEGDARRARMVDFGGPEVRAGIVDDMTAEARMAGRPLFATPAYAVAIAENKSRTTDRGSAKTSIAPKTGLPAKTLHTTLVAATRARLDAFGAPPDSSTTSPANATRKHKAGAGVIPGLKRKRQSPSASTQSTPVPDTCTPQPVPSTKASSLAQGAEHATPSTTSTSANSNGSYIPQPVDVEATKQEFKIKLGSSGQANEHSRSERSLAAKASSTRISTGIERAGAGAATSLVGYTSDGCDD